RHTGGGGGEPMARVTVEDCIDKVENRFDLVLLASHRARMVSSGSPITVDRDHDKNPVVALREIADKTISPDDLKEELVHSLQKYVEVDEPEPAAVPLIGAAGATVDAGDTEVTVDRMTEEELLKGLEGLAPPEEQPDEEESRLPVTTVERHGGPPGGYCLWIRMIEYLPCPNAPKVAD